MYRIRHNAIKVRIISGLFALSAFNYGTAQAAATVSAPTATAVSAAFSIDTTATDFYIFGDNVQKSGGTVFGDVTGTSEVATNSSYSVAWSGGAPTASSTGSMKYDVCALGSSYSPKATSCSFALKMPSSTATLDVWLRPNGNTGTLTYDVTVGGVKNSYSDASGIQRLTYSITNATVGETITFQVHNVVGSNGWHNIGFQAAQLKTPKTDQTISFSPALTGTVGQTATLSATASSGLATTIVSSTPTICTLSGTTLSFAAVGTCTVTANQAGNTAYNAATQISANIVVSNAPKTNQTISFNALAAKVFGDADFNVSATATSNLPVTLSATGSCSITNSTVKITAAGDCSIKASQVGDTTYNAATDVTQTFIISKANQIVTFTPALTGTAGQSTTLSATGGLSNSAIVFASSTPTICTVTGSSVAFAAVGTCTVTANQAGNANYNAATEVSANIVVSNAPKTDQTITFSPALTGTVGTNATLSATATSGLTAITFVSSPSTVCTISGNSVSFVSAGNCIVTANQVGNDKFNAAKEVSATIVVSAIPKTDQTISFSPILTGTIGTTVDLSATATSGLTAITFVSSPSTVCTISGNTVSFVSAGNCIVTANQVGNDKFNAAKQVSATIVVSAAEIIKQEQSLSLQLNPSTGIAGDVLTVNITKGESGNAVTLSSSTTDICSVQNTSVTLLKEGTCSVVAAQAGNTQYLEASASGSVLVKTNQAIFSAKVLSNKDTSGQLTQVSQLDTVNVSLKVVPAPRDIGKNADLFLTVKMGTNWFILTPESWKAWDTTTLTPVKQATLNGTIEVPIFSGQLPITGNLEFYAAYRLVGNSQLDQGAVQILTLTVNEANPVELAKANCLGQNGVYYAQRCFTDAKNLGNSFAGGIYQSEQTGLQTSVNLACRLGKKVAILGRFNPSATDIGKTAEVVLAFALGTGKIYQYDGSGFNELTDIAALSGKPIGALPAVYSAAFFEGELPTTGNFATFLGYRLLNSDGTKGELKYAGGLSLSAPIESCDNPSLKLNTLPLGTGKGEVITKANDDGTVRLIATAATDGGAFAGWTGDAEGCQGTETTVTLKPSADKFTCQPTFNKSVLGTWNCVNGQDPEYGACCDLNDPKCPAFPTTCKTSVNDDEQWFYVSTNSNYINMLYLSNAGTAAVDAQFSAYDANGSNFRSLIPGGSVLGVSGKVTVNPQTTLRASIPDIVSPPLLPRGVLRFTGKGLTAAAWAIKNTPPSPFDISPLMQLSAIPRVEITPGILDEVIDYLILLNSKNLATGGKTVEARLRYVLRNKTLMTAANIKQSTVTLKPGVMNRLKLDDLVTVSVVVAQSLDKIEVIHPDPAQRCTGEALTAFQRTNTKSGNWIGYGGR